MPLDFLVPIVAILMGGSMILIPIVGLTLRFAIKPSVEAIGRAIAESQGRLPAGARAGEDAARIMELEDEVATLRGRLERVEAVQRFDRQLSGSS